MEGEKSPSSTNEVNMIEASTFKMTEKDWERMPIIMRQEDQQGNSELAVINPKTKSEKEIKFLREMVTCEFSNLSEPGLSINFSYQGKKFQLFHGGKYRIPRFLQRHVESCSIPIYGWKPDGQGQMAKNRIGSKSDYQMREVYSG